MAEKPNVVFVLGAPGAGKGTQCQKIKEKFGYEHLSAGDLLRAEMKTDSKDSALISSFIKDGKIVPVEITCSLLLKAMKNSPKSHFVIDGFPRNENNLLGWNKTVKDDVNLKFVLFFECDTQVGVERCMKRGKSSGRSDDNEESLKKRIITYTEETMPIILHYEKMNKVNRVKAEKGPDEVFGEVSKLLEG